MRIDFFFLISVHRNFQKGKKLFRYSVTFIRFIGEKKKCPSNDYAVPT